MREAKISELFSRAFTRTSEILFDRFSWKIWIKFAVVVYFAGAVTSCSINLNNSSGRGERLKGRIPAAASVTAPSTQAGKTASGIAAPAAPAQAAAQPVTAKSAPSPNWADRWGEIPLWIRAAVLAAVAVLIGMYILLLWYRSRMKFVLFNNIALKESGIVEPFHRHAAEARAIFYFQITLAVISITITLALLATAIYALVGSGAFRPGFGWSTGIVVRAIVGPVVFFLLVHLALWFFSIRAEYLVIPVMALRSVSFGTAWEKVGDIYAGQMKEFILFVLLVFLMGLISGVGAAVFMVLIVIVMALLGLLVFGAGYLVLVTGLKLMPVFIGYAVIVGVPFVALLLGLIILSFVPLAVFGRSFMWEYFLSLRDGHMPSDLADYAGRRSEKRSRGPVIWPAAIMVLCMVAVLTALIAVAIPSIAKARVVSASAQSAKTV